MDVAKGKNKLVLLIKRTKRLKNKDAIYLIIQIATKFGFPETNAFRLKMQLATSVQMLIPVLQDYHLMELSVRFDLSVWLQSKNPEKITYMEWLKFMTCFFMQPPLGRIHRFIARYNAPISVSLAILVPVTIMLITIFHK